ncbi:MAG: two-component regulator propeller domain-containing protein [Vicinamibacterales bacterium]
MHLVRLPSLLLVSALCLPGLSQATDLRNVLTGYSVTSWSQLDGLPAGVVYALAQDDDGYLWIATDDGPYRFDGVRFSGWDQLSDEELPSKTVRALRVDRTGALWVGYGGAGGVSRLAHARADNFGPAEGLPASAVSSLVEDAHGLLWAGTGVGLFFFRDGAWHKFPSDRGLPDESVFTATFLDGRKQMYVGNALGFYRYRDVDQRFEQVEATSDIPRAIADDPLGNLLVTDEIAAFRQVGARQGPVGFSGRGRGRQLLRDRRGNLWVGTSGQGLWRVRFDPAGGVLFTERATALSGLLADGVVALIEDREGNIWSGTIEGLNRLTPHKVAQITEIGLVAGVEAGREGSVWIGTVDELIRFDSSTARRADERIAMGGARLRSLHTDERGTLWVGTTQGLARVSGGRLVPVAVATPDDMPRQVDTITSDGRGGVWLFDIERGLLRYNGGRFWRAPLPRSLARTRVSATYTDSTGRAWFAFSDGHIAMSAGEELRILGPENGVDGGVYQAIYEDGHHAIWLGGTAGLTRYTDGRFVTLRQGNGFPVNNLTAIVEDDADYLWLGSGVGIIRIHRDECAHAARDPAYQVQYRLYDRGDGLAGLPFVYSTNRRAIRASDGGLWFVTARGLTVIDPDEMRTDEAKRPVRIEGIVADGVRVRGEINLALPARTSRVEIEFTTLNLTSPLKQQFRYRLEGFDADWISAGTRRQAFYTNLPPRAYRFRVMSSDIDGSWIGPGETIAFEIEPVFYQTRWFMALAVGLLVTAVAGAWRIHVRQVRRQFALLIGERARLSRAIHDTLLQSLVGIALQCDAMANDTASSQQRDRFVRMRKQVEEYIREARQSIWDLRSPQLANRDLVSALREAGERATTGAGVGFSLSVSGHPRRLSSRVEEQLLRIGQEAVVNAVRHARADHVQVEIEFGDETLSLRVHDNGQGFEPARVAASHANGHYGLTSMRERAEQVGGRLHVESAPGRGTHIEATVPTAPAAGRGV